MYPKIVTLGLNSQVYIRLVVYGPMLLIWSHYFCSLTENDDPLHLSQFLIKPSKGKVSPFL